MTCEEEEEEEEQLTLLLNSIVNPLNCICHLILFQIKIFRSNREREKTPHSRTRSWNWNENQFFLLRDRSTSNDREMHFSLRWSQFADRFDENEIYNYPLFTNISSRVEYVDFSWNSVQNFNIRFACQTGEKEGKRENTCFSHSLSSVMCCSLCASKTKRSFTFNRVVSVSLARSLSLSFVGCCRVVFEFHRTEHENFRCTLFSSNTKRNEVCCFFPRVVLDRYLWNNYKVDESSCFLLLLPPVFNRTSSLENHVSQSVIWK